MCLGKELNASETIMANMKTCMEEAKARMPTGTPATTEEEGDKKKGRKHGHHHFFKDPVSTIRKTSSMINY
jgi:hypothetical protein